MTRSNAPGGVRLAASRGACYGRCMTARAPTSQQAADALLLDVRPPQGCWTEKDYLWLTDRCNRLVEFADGHIEELPVATDTHQTVLKRLFRLFDRHVDDERGLALFAPLRLRIRPGRFREPDLLVLRDVDDPRRQDRYWLGADLVLEVVSPDDPDRDYVAKRADYADLGVPEYWIVDPRAGTITVLALKGGAYVDRGVFGPGGVATSTVLDGFRVLVSDVFEGLSAS